ncbi:MAG: hypothetical protein QM759_01765 [Terricaulis sp.]
MAAQQMQKAVEYFAARSHDAWRREFHKNNPDQKAQPRMRMRGGKMVDINQPWSSLDSAAKADNMIAAEAAYSALERYPKNREKAAAFVHKQWVKRNRTDPNQSPDLFKPYAELPEIEKDKDRVHIDQMKAALAAVAKPKKAKAKKDKKPGKAKKEKLPGLQLDAAMAARLDAAAAALSKATGREISAQALLVAGAEAVLVICETAAPSKRKKKS